MECVTDVSNLLNNKLSIARGESQIDRLRHTFIKSPDEIAPLYSECWDPFIYISCWEQVIDSEYAARCLSLRLRSEELFRIYTWAKNTGNNSLAGAVYEILLHRLAADNQLDIHISEYDPPENYQPNAPRHFNVKQVHLEKHKAIIVKLKSTSGKKGNVAYLQFTVAAQHGIDSNQLKEMNKIFYPDDVKEAGNTEPPIYIAVCPDLESCKALRLNPAPQVVAAKQVCQVFVGYYAENKYGIAADGPTNDKIVKSLLPHTHNLRKRQRLEE
ncbi:unnamed protein product [Peronospora farinosa]|uniref:Uncharacterized protein n=1 Tax=Peronospora farinosa TaxID=134698 RepID=A0AAV0T4B8_9STRA|nr:unnamed protein product [Peronospora farinosa]CAI5711762.1 unnamed protein product [Peronospora farinosa]